MKQEDVNSLNVDDYIRERKRAGAKYIIWEKKAEKSLKEFLERTGFSLKKTPDGDLFWGVKHYFQD